MIDAIEEWLRGCLGVTKIPLAYVIRPEEAVLPEVLDPPSHYASTVLELVSRAPIRDTFGAYTPDYLKDRELVWQKLSALTRPHDCWSYVRPAQKATDGREAFIKLQSHYLGMNNANNMAAEAEFRLQHARYQGEQRRWNFEQYVKSHIDQHHILNNLHEYGYSGIDEWSKVRYLVGGIHTNAFDAVKTRIMSDASLRCDFEGCINLFKDFIKQQRTGNDAQEREAKVAAAQRTAQFGGHDGREGNPEQLVEDRYYTRQEYAKLSNAAKDGLRLKRLKRGHVSGEGSPPQPNKKVKTDLSQREIMALANKVHWLSMENEQANEEEDAPMEQAPVAQAPPIPPITNRLHSALRRKK